VAERARAEALGRRLADGRVDLGVAAAAVVQATDAKRARTQLRNLLPIHPRKYRQQSVKSAQSLNLAQSLLPANPQCLHRSL
jgi:hypothetical protein